MNLRKLIVAVLLLVCIAAFFVFDMQRFFSLAYLKESQETFAALYDQRPVLVTAIFFAVYVAVTALSLPGAAIMTLAAGAAFGLVFGTVLVSFASTIGATLAMLAARYMLRDTIQKRFGQRLAEVNKGIEKEGALYLFTLRLIPVVPFFALNLLMGLSRMKTWTYFWVSQLGMLAGTVAFVNAGTQIAKIDSLKSILSPGLIGSFVLLGLLPLVVKRVLDYFKSRKVYARWRSAKPAKFDRNLVVIGAGAGGLVTAYIAAVVKAKVTLIEAHKMGGDCLNYGCVPSKALIRSATLAHQMRHGAVYGLSSVEPSFSFKAVMQRIQAVVRAIQPHDSVERYTALGVDVVQGHAHHNGIKILADLAYFRGAHQNAAFQEGMHDQRPQQQKRYPAGGIVRPMRGLVVHMAVLHALRKHFQQQLPKETGQHPVAHPLRVLRQQLQGLGQNMRDGEREQIGPTERQ